MYNASDVSLNAQININAIIDGKVEIEIIIKEISFCYIMSCLYRFYSNSEYSYK